MGPWLCTIMCSVLNVALTSLRGRLDGTDELRWDKTVPSDGPSDLRQFMKPSFQTCDLLLGSSYTTPSAFLSRNSTERSRSRLHNAAERFYRHSSFMPFNLKLYKPENALGKKKLKKGVQWICFVNLDVCYSS